MSGRVVPSPYRTQYNAAVKLFDDGHVDASVALAKFNVAQAKAKSTRTLTEFSRDPTIPPYFCMKNAVLIASGLDDWEDADYWRLAAEQKNATGLKIAEQAQDQGSLRALQQVREELDRFNEFREQDPAEYMAQGSTPDDEENDHDDEKEDQDDEEEGRDDGGEGQDGEEGRRRGGEETVEHPVLLSSERNPQSVSDTTTLQRGLARRSL